MRLAGRSGFERWLGSIRLKPAPPGLRGSTLTAAARRREEALWTTPLLRRCLAACAVLMAAVVVVDGVTTRAQEARFQAIINGAGAAQSDLVRQWNADLEELSNTVGPEGVGRGRWLMAAHWARPSPGPAEDIW